MRPAIASDEAVLQEALATIRDVAADGRILIDQGDTRSGIVVVSDNGDTQRDVSWLDYSFLRTITSDGKTILFVGTKRQALMRGAPPV